MRFWPEAEFWDIIGTKALSKSDLKLVCYVNIVYGNLKSENFKIMARNLNEIVRS
jgi:hypothetical protein